MFFLCKQLAVSIVRAPIQEWLVIHEFNKWEGAFHLLKSVLGISVLQFKIYL